MVKSFIHFFIALTLVLTSFVQPSFAAGKKWKPKREDPSCWVLLRPDATIYDIWECGGCNTENTMKPVNGQVACVSCAHVRVNEPFYTAPERQTANGSTEVYNPIFVDEPVAQSGPTSYRPVETRDQNTGKRESHIVEEPRSRRQSKVTQPGPRSVQVDLSVPASQSQGHTETTPKSTGPKIQISKTQAMIAAALVAVGLAAGGIYGYLPAEVKEGQILSISNDRVVIEYKDSDGDTEQIRLKVTRDRTEELEWTIGDTVYIHGRNLFGKTGVELENGDVEDQFE